MLELHTGLPFGVAQTRPHAPQLLVEVWVFTSQPLDALPSQFAKPVLQVVTAHAPAAQPLVALLSAQTAPHAPQLLTSACRVRHTPEQLV